MYFGGYRQMKTHPVLLTSTECREMSNTGKEKEEKVKYIKLGVIL